MEISYTLIVALMYVTVLSFGFASILTTISQVIRKGNDIQVSPLHLNWLLILLLVHFNMVWHSVLFTNIETWTYHAFLLIVLGPTLAFFAANILVPEPSENVATDSLSDKYFSVIQQFLIFFAIIQLWTLLADYLLGRWATGSAVFNVILLVFSVFLYKTPSAKAHANTLYVVWAVYLVSIVLRSLELID